MYQSQSILIQFIDKFTDVTDWYAISFCDRHELVKHVSEVLLVLILIICQHFFTLHIRILLTRLKLLYIALKTLKLFNYSHFEFTL